jgi:hypothetical protein
MPNLVEETQKPDIKPTSKPSFSINFADNESKHPGITITPFELSFSLNLDALSFDLILENITII